MNYEMNNNPVCPYCDYAVDDMCSWGEMGVSHEDDGESDVTCPDCNKDFHVTTHISYTFSTVGLNCPKHKLEEMHRSTIEDGSTAIRYICTECKEEIYNWSLDGGKYQKYTEGQYEIIKELGE